MTLTTLPDRVTVIGCGWLGLPMAKLLASRGVAVRGTTTRQDRLAELTADGIEAHLFRLGDQAVDDSCRVIFDSQVLMVNIPPGRNSLESPDYPSMMRHLADAVADSPLRHVLFVSSTAVYPNLNREVFEHEQLLPDRENGQQLLTAENVWRKQNGISVTILRPGGLLGAGRHPAKYLSGRSGLTNGDAPVNLIHLDDMLGILECILEQQVWGEIFQAAAPQHPLRREFYRDAAARLKLPLPEFAAGESPSFKIINSGKLIKQLGYTFKHPDPASFPG